MLYIIGLGLGDDKDITVAGLEAVKASDRLFLEHYTSVLGVSAERLVRVLGLCVCACVRKADVCWRCLAVGGVWQDSRAG